MLDRRMLAHSHLLGASRKGRYEASKAVVLCALTTSCARLFTLQSYGIKVGYGAGAANQQTAKVGEEQKKASTCC